jgi:2-hydroxycyclohexanecarboxyl-CoA dehydrogenase
MTRPRSTAVVTGGGGGIGGATCRALDEAGHHVSAWDVSTEGLARTRALMEGEGRELHTALVDITNAAAITAALDEATGVGGPPAVLVHAAGQIDFCNFEALSPEQVRRMLDVHVLGAVLTMQAVLPGMVAQGFGRIVNFGSVAAFSGSSRHAHYAAAKGAVVALTKAVAKAHGRDGVTINCIAPGAIDTDMFAQVDETALAYYADNPVGRIGTPEDIAAAVAYLVSPAAGFVTGAVVHVNGGMYL